MLFDDCACTCSVGVLFHFLQAVEQIESAFATRGYCARKKEEIKYGYEVERGSCGHFCISETCSINHAFCKVLKLDAREV